MFRSAGHYGDHLNSYDALKLIALFTMVIDHVGYYLLPDTDMLRAIGRMAFPLFLFLVGYSGAWKGKYDLALWAALITVSAALTHHAVFPLDILVTILIVRLGLPRLLAMGKLTPEKLAAIVIACVFWYPAFYWCEYSTIALLFALCGVLQRHYPHERMTPLFLCTTMALHLGVESLAFSSLGLDAQIAMFLSLALVACLMYRFTLRPLDSGALPAPLRRALQWAARNTLPIYGLHVIALMAIERICFPERLPHFQWIGT